MDNQYLAKITKAYPCVALATGNIRTCPVRLSYPNLFKPGKPVEEGQEPKFGAALLFPLGADISVLREAVNHAAIEAFGSKAASMRLAKPFRDQSEKAAADGAEFNGYTPGAVFFNCSSKQRPGIVGPDGKPITDPNRVYPGVWALVTVRPFGYDRGVKKGVSLGLQNVQIIADDDRIGGGRASAGSEFAPLDGSLGVDFGGGTGASATQWD